MEEVGANQATTGAAQARSTCSSCGGASGVVQPGYVTLVGQVSMSFPSLAVEKEFSQLLGKKDFHGFTDRQTMYDVLSKAQNRYLARKMCATFTIFGAGSEPGYVLVPEVQNDLDLLIDTLSRPPGASELDVVKGRIVGMSPPHYCNHLELPVVSYSQLYSFSPERFVKGVPRSEKMDPKSFEPVANDTFHRLLRKAANGVGHIRSLTYAALSYSGLYQLAAEKNAENFSLEGISVHPAQSNAARTEIRLKFVRRDTGFTEAYRFTVNSSDAFEFLEDALHPSYEFS